MDWTLELQGSEVQVTELDSDLNGGQVRLLFSAALVRQGQGRASEAGHVKGIELRFAEARWTGGDPALCLGALADSTLTINGLRYRDMPLPFQVSGDVRAEFTFRAGTTLTLSARTVQGLPPPDPHFQASYAC